MFPKRYIQIETKCFQRHLVTKINYINKNEFLLIIDELEIVLIY